MTANCMMDAKILVLIYKKMFVLKILKLNTSMKDSFNIDKMEFVTFEHESFSI